MDLKTVAVSHHNPRDVLSLLKGSKLRQLILINADLQTPDWSASQVARSRHQMIWGVDIMSTL